MRASNPHAPFPNYTYAGIVPKLAKNIGNISGIYGIFCNASKKIYVGQSKNIANRWRGHISLLRGNKSHSPKLQKSWNEYGEKSHLFFIIKNTTDLDKEEQFLISALNPQLNDSPFTKGFKHTKETKEKMKRNHANVSGRNNPMYGIKLIGDKNPMFGRKRPDTVEFNRKTKKGKHLSKSHCKKISKSLKGNQYARKI